MNSAFTKEKKPKFSPGDVLYELANMIEPGIGLFRKKCNGLYDWLDDVGLLERRDELRLLWVAQSGIREYLMRLPINLKQLSDKPISLMWEDGKAFNINISRADRLEKEWFESGACANGVLIQEHICRYWIILDEGKGWDVTWTKDERGIKGSPQSLSKVLLMTSIRLGDRFAYCRNPECSAPFFLARRRDQVYCSSDCSGYGQRAAKLKWWHENRGKLAQNSDEEAK